MLKIETQSWKDKVTGEKKEKKVMKIQGKLMGENETISLVCLVDDGLVERTIKYKDKKTNEEKTFDVGSIFTVIADTDGEGNGFTAEFSGQALREIKKFKEASGMGKGTRYTITRSIITMKKTGAMFPIINVLKTEDVKAISEATPEQLSNAKTIMEGLMKPKVVEEDAVTFTYTPEEEKLIKLVKEQGESIDTLMYNLKAMQSNDADSVVDLNKDRFTIRL